MSSIEEFKKSYKFHEETLSYFELVKEAGFGSYMDQPSVAEARLLKEKVSQKFSGEVEFEEKHIKEYFVPLRGGSKIPVTSYRSKNCNLVVKPPILIYFHGGGNVVGSRKTHDAICRIISRDSPCVVVNVEYRLAPEHKFPANNDDAVCVLRWVMQNKALLGTVNECHVGVGGDSAGGRLAAVVCHELPDINFQVLIYPSVDRSKVYPTHEEFKDFPGLSKEMIDWFNEKYFREDENLSDTRISPILRENFQVLPPALFIVAEFDALRDSVRAYYEKMKKAGVSAQLYTVKGVLHGFFNMPGHFKECSKIALEKICKFITTNS